MRCFAIAWEIHRHNREKNSSLGNMPDSFIWNEKKCESSGLRGIVRIDSFQLLIKHLVKHPKVQFVKFKGK